MSENSISQNKPHENFEPAINKTAFNCPHCGVRAKQEWHQMYSQVYKPYKLPRRDYKSQIIAARDKLNDTPSHNNMHEFNRVTRLAKSEIFQDVVSNQLGLFATGNLDIAICDHCGKISVWIVNAMVFPSSGEILAHVDLPSPVKQTFNEASKVLKISPRASAALSRLAIQQLCVELGCTSKNLDGQIGELVDQGLNPTISKMLDGVRVVGNNAVHPGEIDMSDDQQTASFLLHCINRICQRIITEKREADELFQMLPDGAKPAIEKRDK